MVPTESHKRYAEMLTNDAIQTLRNQAYQVYEPWPARSSLGLSARGVARRLWPYIYAASTRYGEDGMRAACAFLATTHPAKWGDAASALEISLASTAAALLRESTQENVQAALAFWASETDPSIWQAAIH